MSYKSIFVFLRQSVSQNPTMLSSCGSYKWSCGFKTGILRQNTRSFLCTCTLHILVMLHQTAFTVSHVQVTGGRILGSRSGNISSTMQLDCMEGLAKTPYYLID